jgi:hypothetical protein
MSVFDTKKFNGLILFEDVMPEQILKELEVTEYRVEEPSMCYTCDYRSQRVRISVTDDKIITSLCQG